MIYNYYRALIEEAQHYDSEDLFVGAYGYPENCSYSPENLQRIFYIIYTVSNNNFPALIELSGMSFKIFSEKYNIPQRTALHWKMGDRTAPEYVMQLIGYAMICEIPTIEQYEE